MCQTTSPGTRESAVSRDRANIEDSLGGPTVSKSRIQNTMANGDEGSEGKFWAPWGVWQQLETRSGRLGQASTQRLCVSQNCLHTQGVRGWHRRADHCSREKAGRRCSRQNTAPQARGRKDSLEGGLGEWPAGQGRAHLPPGGSLVGWQQLDHPRLGFQTVLGQRF